MPFLFNKYYPLRNIIFFFGEGWLMFLSILLSGFVGAGQDLFIADLPTNCMQAVAVTCVFHLSLYFFDLYDLQHDNSLADTLGKMMQAFGAGCMVLGLLYYALPPIVISAKVFWIGYLVLCLAVCVWRSVYYFVLRKKLFRQDVVIVGTGQFACEIAEEIEGRHDSVYKIAAFVGSSEPAYNPNSVEVFSKIEDVEELLQEKGIERIIIALDERRGVLPIHILLKHKLRGILIEYGLSFYERITGKILVKRADPSSFIFSPRLGLSRWQYMIQRARDVSFALVIFLLTLPIMLLTALAVKLESAGPVLYIQERVGLYGRVFKLVKFRSMYCDAEKNGAVWAAQDDERITRCGSFIRKTRIDELPQLWNVLRGEMSLVGPRPERPVFVEQLVETLPFYSLRHDVKPGLTGWAQISYPYGASVEDALKKLEYDLYYVKNVSMSLDLLVIFHTIKIVLFQKGSR